VRLARMVSPTGACCFDAC